MYQLAPISLKPEVRASRSQHGQFQNKLAAVTDKLADEREVLDMSHEKAKLLFNMMDKFFSYGLFSGDQAYWRFVREFLPKTEHFILKAEWGDVNDRRLSMAWLKDAFNKGTLAYQMMAFKEDKKVITRYYHPNACMMNGGMLEAVTEMMERLVAVQFAFFSRLHLRQEPAQAVVVNSASSQSAKALKAKKHMELDDKNPVVPNVPTPDARQYDVSNNTDQDAMLAALMQERKNRRHRYNSTHQISFDKEEQDYRFLTNSCPSEPPKIQETLNTVLQKTLSQVRMEHVGEPSFEKMLLMEEEKNKQAKEEDPTVEGEEVVEQADLLQLNMNVFTESGEKLLKMYNVFDRFAVGVPGKRMIAITLHNIYILSKTVTQGDTLEGGTISMYFPHCIIPLDALDSIDVSFDYQQFYFYAKHDIGFVFEDETAKETFVSVGTGDKTLGKAILGTIENAFKNCRKELPPILIEESPHTLILERYLSKEFSLSPSSKIDHLSLIYWKESPASVQQVRMDHSGFLFWRFNQTNWWRRPQNEFEQCYFLLRQDRKLYIFRDSSMKEGIQIFDLRNCLETLELDQKKDCQWSFELVFPEGNLQLLSQSKDDLVKWLQLISGCLTCSDGIDASAAMCIITETDLTIAQEGSNCVTDGFVRTLVSFPLNEIREGWVLMGGESLLSIPHTALVLRIDNYYEWFFFRSETELDRMKTALGKYPFQIEEIINSNQSRDAAIIVTAAERCPELWGKPVYDSNVAEVFEN